MKFFTSKIKIALVAMVVSSIYQISHAGISTPSMDEVLKCTIAKIGDKNIADSFYESLYTDQCNTAVVRKLLKYHEVPRYQFKHADIITCANNMTPEGIDRADKTMNDKNEDFKVSDSASKYTISGLYQKLSEYCDYAGMIEEDRMSEDYEE